MAVTRDEEELARPFATAGLIDSDGAEGRDVYNACGDHIGAITRLMIDRVTGKVTHAMVRFDGAQEDESVAWSSLTFDAQVEGYRVGSKVN